MEVPSFAAFTSGSWRVACYNRCKPSTRKRMDSALRTQLLPTFGHRPIDQIDRRAVQEWFDRYSKVAPAGANRVLDVLRQVFNHGIECGRVDRNPTRGIRHNPRPRCTRFLSREEIRRVYAALDAHRGRESGRQQATIIRLLLLTGCRKSEMIRLRWTEVADGVLRLSEGKTGPRTVFLCPAAQTILAAQPKADSPYVFPSPTDRTKPRSSELSLWRKVRREARVEDVRLHDLRHTFASHAVMRRVPLPVVAHLLGHSRRRMSLRYAHIGDQVHSDNQGET